MSNTINKVYMTYAGMEKFRLTKSDTVKIETTETYTQQQSHEEQRGISG